MSSVVHRIPAGRPEGGHIDRSGSSLMLGCVLLAVVAGWVSALLVFIGGFGLLSAALAFPAAGCLALLLAAVVARRKPEDISMPPDQKTDQ
ncbi:hypothetical protein [Szabonella alba]|uniref:Uncharacterized protein n=1 Tax=Szabonella alba TaxID=2804194 RepID=A0A8K0Y2S6_9RHOB|nr:hypothetical protein [Szabonella alba]MBL4919039.1 hypothetical protein [Szabonella alba]